jgi:type IV pilus assembly protein PilA
MGRFRNRSRVRRGFTLVELLVVVLILATLMSVALPLYLAAISDAQRKACRANMQTISNAVMAARVRSLASSYTSIITSGLTTANLQDLQAIPVCPNQGTYSLVSINSGASFSVSCSASNHGTFQPGVDYQ